MAIDDESDALKFRQEGASVRAKARNLNVLFPKSQKDAIVSAYDEWQPRVQAHFEPRWRAHDGANVPEAEFQEIVREVTLYWMGYCVMHRKPVQMGAAEWDEAQSRRIIRVIVERRFPRGSDDAADLCARIMGISRDDYVKWAQAEDTFLGIK